MKQPHDIGKHIASLNLFLESDGCYYITVSKAQKEALTRASKGGVSPMEFIANCIADAGPRFVRSWGKKLPERYRGPHDPGGLSGNCGD